MHLYWLHRLQSSENITENHGASRWKKSGVHQLRLVVSPIIYKDFIHPNGGFLAGIPVAINSNTLNVWHVETRMLMDGSWRWLFSGGVGWNHHQRGWRCYDVDWQPEIRRENHVVDGAETRRKPGIWIPGLNWWVYRILFKWVGEKPPTFRHRKQQTLDEIFLSFNTISFVVGVNLNDWQSVVNPQKGLYPDTQCMVY